MKYFGILLTMNSEDSRTVGGRSQRPLPGKVVPSCSVGSFEETLGDLGPVTVDGGELIEA